MLEVTPQEIERLVGIQEKIICSERNGAKGVIFQDLVWLADNLKKSYHKLEDLALQIHSMKRSIDDFQNKLHGGPRC